MPPAATMVELKPLVREVVAFAARHGLTTPEDVLFDELGAALLTPPGTGAELLFAGLSGAASADGVTYSLLLCGSLTVETSGEAALDRIALPIIVTSVSAAFGNIETDLMQRLASRGRPFAVVLLGFRREPDAEHRALFAEIDEFKLTPLRRELGVFPVFDDRGALLEQLRTWVAETVDAAARRRLVVNVSDWMDTLETRIGEGIAVERLHQRHLDRVWDHLQQLLPQLEDAVGREQDELLLADERDEVSASLARRVDVRVTSLGREFAKFYGDLVPPFEPARAGALDPAGLKDWVQAVSDGYRTAVEDRFHRERAAMRWAQASEEFARLRTRWEAAR